MGIALRPITPRGMGAILVRDYRTSVLHFTRLALDAAAWERGGFAKTRLIDYLDMG